MIRLHAPADTARRALLAMAVVAGLTACRHDDTPDAYGTFESEETVVSTDVGGRLLRFSPVEGARLAAGEVVADIDPVQLGLQRDEMTSQHDAARAHVEEVTAQGAALEAQRRIAKRAYDRTRRLWADSAATTQQLDEATRQLAVLRDQIAANARARSGAAEQARAASARVAQAAERLGHTQVHNAVSGTVLATYVRRAELVQPGTPLYRIAPLDTMTLRAYVSEPQLAGLALGRHVQVAYDVSGGRRQTTDGVVTWVASQAEFTPTPIQTRDERADQVYAVKVRVPNPRGALKIGMPGELRLATPARPRR